MTYEQNTTRIDWYGRLEIVKGRIATHRQISNSLRSATLRAEKFGKSLLVCKVIVLILTWINRWHCRNASLRLLENFKIGQTQVLWHLVRLILLTQRFLNLRHLRVSEQISELHHGFSPWMLLHHFVQLPSLHGYSGPKGLWGSCQFHFCLHMERKFKDSCPADEDDLQLAYHDNALCLTLAKLALHRALKEELSYKGKISCPCSNFDCNQVRMLLWLCMLPGKRTHPTRGYLCFREKEAQTQHEFRVRFSLTDIACSPTARFSNWNVLESAGRYRIADLPSP